MVFIWVFISQALFNIFKVLEIRYTLHHQLRQLLLNSIWIGLVALASTFYSIDALLKGNFAVIIFYIAGNLVGKYIGMKIEVNERGESVSSNLY